MPKYAVLSDVSIEGAAYKAGAVIECSEALAKPLVAGLLLDPEKDAVAAREAQGAKSVKHAKPVENAASVEARDAERRG